jgi:hypothetical protein
MQNSGSNCLGFLYNGKMSTKGNTALVTIVSVLALAAVTISLANRHPNGSGLNQGTKPHKVHREVDTSTQAVASSTKDEQVRQILKSMKDQKIANRDRLARKLSSAPSLVRDTLVVQAHKSNVLSDWETVMALGGTKNQFAFDYLATIRNASKDQNVKIEAYISMRKSPVNGLVRIHSR